MFFDVSESHDGVLYYLNNNGEDTPKIQSSDGQSDIEVTHLLDLDVRREGASARSDGALQIIASRLIPWVDGRQWADLFYYREGRWQAITQRQRFRKVQWLNAHEVLASRKIAGVSELWRVSLTGEQRLVWRGETDSWVLGEFDVSPSGDYVIASLKRPAQGWNLERLELKELASAQAQRSWQPVTDTLAVGEQPADLSVGRHTLQRRLRRRLQPLSANA